MRRYTLLLGEGKRYPKVMERYKATVVGPRRELMRSVLRRGVATGELRADLDVEIALFMLTGAIMAPGPGPRDVHPGVRRAARGRGPAGPGPALSAHGLGWTAMKSQVSLIVQLRHDSEVDRNFRTESAAQRQQRPGRSGPRRAGGGRQPRAPGGRRGRAVGTVTGGADPAAGAGPGGDRGRRRHRPAAGDRGGGGGGTARGRAGRGAGRGSEREPARHLAGHDRRRAARADPAGCQYPAAGNDSGARTPRAIRSGRSGRGWEPQRRAGAAGYQIRARLGTTAARGRRGLPDPGAGGDTRITCG